MKVALKVALGGVGNVSPNPLVGAVLLDRQGVCLATGFHAKLGGPHAEAALLNQIGDDRVPEGSTMLVTLEPCAHEGRTPSCAKRMAKLPLSEVIYGLADPGPHSGGGARILKEAGINASEYHGTLKEELRELSEIFYHNVQAGLPFVALKCGSTLDGKIAIRESGESQWITGAESRKQSHYLRALYDGVLVGEGTFVADNPSLNVRHPDFPSHEGKVIVLSERSESWPKLQNSKIFFEHKPQNIIWICSEGFAPRQTGDVTVLEVPQATEGSFDFNVLLKSLFEVGVRSVLVEGGSRTLSSFLTERAAQRLHLFMAPKILGGLGLGWSDTLSVRHLGDAVRVDSGRWTLLGEDLYLTARL